MRQKHRKSRWKRVIAAVGDLAEESLAIMYVYHNFSKKGEQVCKEMVDIFTEVLRDWTIKLEWMIGDKNGSTCETQQVSNKIGYSDK